MKKGARHLVVILTVVLGIATCGGDGDEPPVEKRVCERLDECNVQLLLMSIQDCTEHIQSCSEDLLSSAYKDWRTMVEDCLDLANCQTFAACYDDIDVCYLGDLDGGGDGSGGSEGSDGSGGSEGSDGSGGSGGSEGSDGSGGSEGSDGSGGSEGSDGSGGSTAACTELDTSCVDANTIEICLDGAWGTYDCDFVCEEAFGVGAISLGCEYVPEEGIDDCICLY